MLTLQLFPQKLFHVLMCGQYRGTHYYDTLLLLTHCWTRTSEQAEFSPGIETLYCIYLFFLKKMLAHILIWISWKVYLQRKDSSKMTLDFYMHWCNPFYCTWTTSFLNNWHVNVIKKLTTVYVCNVQYGHSMYRSMDNLKGNSSEFWHGCFTTPFDLYFQKEFPRGYEISGKAAPILLFTKTVQPNTFVWSHSKQAINFLS
jgi:hypothetical protein